ncbi:MAG: aminopeptidase P family protein [Chloroflexi bacterium]|nr:aminopeptidase P family protein [Chloroflexota bacterium]MBA3740510.1 aminopeptidase P family protein [Chloroflexota bacterium]
MTTRAVDVGNSAGSSGATIHRERLRRAAAEAAERGLDALLITPSPDYAYLLGYRAPAMERLTCLVVPADGQPVLVLPRLEEPLARHGLGELADALEIVAWDETDDPIRAVQVLVGSALRVGVQDQMWARFALRLQAALDPAQMVAAGATMSALRQVKSADEIDLLRAAASAADNAMLGITAERLSGRTEAEVSRRIRELLIQAGHDDAGFAIVASGPNSASPHHAPDQRVIGVGDAIVLDIGGMRAGYTSDTSRTAFVGDPPPDFEALHAVLRDAQAAACAAVRPGVPASDIDAVARDLITDAGYGDAFLHRTGHGIGMETHEEPYIVSSNPEPLVAGNAFSVEPGIYIRNTWGARIEDIVICTDTGGERLNTTSTEIYLVE